MIRSRMLSLRMKPVLPSLLVLLSFALPARPAPSLPAAPSPSDLGWTNAPWNDPAFFPIAVWLQSPANAQQYKAAGINTYVGLWRGPNADQLRLLEQAGMRVICHQNAFALSNRHSPTLLAWMHGDEPDNAQSLGEGKGWGPPIPPERIIKGYETMRAADPSRPILLNLGQGVAWDGWYGRGVRSNHPEDYPLYIQGCDIASFDIYPAVHDKPEVAGNLWFVARGVERLVQWGGGRKSVWNCLECTRISNTERKPTPHEVRAEAWMSIIHGSRGLIYFVHQFKPDFREAALLDDPEMLAAVTTLNRQITVLAPVINSRPTPELARVESAEDAVPVAYTVRTHERDVYIFVAAMRGGTTTVRVTLSEATAGSVEEIGDGRRLRLDRRSFEDRLQAWDVRLYRVRAVGRSGGS